ncbi:MAG: hypothetical protein LBK06_10535 [Planctomycetaceae bacterium]|nr:hypothetical protein [Planctomycetaceae bacterium]
MYAEAVLKSKKLDTQAQQRGAFVRGRSLLPYRLRYNKLSASRRDAMLVRLMMES